MRFGGIVLLLLALGCGTVARRPMELRVEGLSALADKLVLVIADGDGEARCPSVDLDSVQSVAGVRTATWMRDEATDRDFALDAIDLPVIDAVVYTEDADGVPIQYACRRYDYEDLETPFQTITLSRVE